MRLPIFLKIFSGFLLIQLILGAGIFFLSFDKIKLYHKTTLSNELKNITSVIILKIQEQWKEGNTSRFDAISKRLGKETKVRITIIRHDGIVLADSEENPLKMENHSNREEIIKAISNKIGISQRYSPTIKEEMLYVAQSVEIEGEIVGVVRASLHLSNIRLFLDELRFDIIKLVGLMILIALFLSFIFTRNITKPIKELVEGSQKVAEGDFKVRIFFNRNDELKQLAESFNEMAYKISGLFEELSSQRDELNTVIASIQEGLLVIDKEGFVKHTNKSLEDIFLSLIHISEPTRPY